jgi:hypothetical protein
MQLLTEIVDWLDAITYRVSVVGCCYLQSVIVQSPIDNSDTNVPKGFIRFLWCGLDYCRETVSCLPPKIQIHGGKKSNLIDGEAFRLCDLLQAMSCLQFGWLAPVNLQAVILQRFERLLVLVIADADYGHLGRLDAVNQVRDTSAVSTCSHERS